MMTNAPGLLGSPTPPPAQPISPSRLTRPARRIAIWLLMLFCLLAGAQAQAAGTWTSLTNTPPSGGVGNMLLLTDGSVMAHVGGTNWARLVPDSTGSYVNGTWTQLAPMHDSRLYFACQVLKDGRVFVAGGEYGNGGSTAETYDPRTNAWTRLPAEGESFSDMPANSLPNGNVLASAGYSSASQGTPILDITTNTWIPGPHSIYGMGEATWLKLADGSILCGEWGADTGAGNAERYLPSLNSWQSECPSFPLSHAGETGPAFLLPNGNALFMGYSQTGIYTPSGNNTPGTWTQGPVVPNGLNCGDSSGAMMVNGIVLFTADPYYLSGPTSYFEYDYTTNACTQITAPPNDYGGVAFNINMLCLPDGDILVTTSTNRPAEYAPGSAPLAAGKPAITGIALNSDGSYTLSGTMLNGITEGASYGDDQQMATNYPIVRLISSGGTVYYARTYNWSSTGLMTGSTPESTQFTLPLGIPPGTYSVVVTANGNPSTASSITIPGTSDAAPTVATAAAASPGTVTGLTTNLSVLGADDGGESNLTYTWTAVAPSGAALPSYSVNASNAAKNTTVTFTHAGTYAFTVTITDAYGLFTTSTVSVSVNQTLTSATVSPALTNLTAGQTKQLSATAYDQFGIAMATQPGFTWALAAGSGTVSSSGLYTSPSSGTAASVTATTGGVQGGAAVYVVSSPWVSTDVGSVAIAGSAYDSSGVFTVNGEGNDIWGTADQFHYVYRTMGGDGMMIARVASQENTGGWAKAGVMVRASTAAGDQYALMLVSAGSGTDLQYRTTPGGSAANVGNTTGLAAPYWVKIVRSGNTITGFRSPNGTTWTKQGSATIAMPGQVLIGLAVDSVDTTQLNTSTFDNLSMLLASNDTLAVNPGAAGTVNVLSNDVGPSGATLTVTAVTQGAKGTVVNNNNGTVTYTAAGNAIGIDSFTYTVSDGLGDTATATVTVTINGLQAYYKMDEGTGTTTADATGDGYTGTITGATWTTGVEGSGGLAFAGTSTSYATIPALNLNSNTVTITGWINRNGSQMAWSGIAFTRASSTACGFHFGTANELRYTWNNSGSTYNWNSGLVPPNGQWTFVALVITPTNATIYMQPLGGSMQSATNSVANSAASFNGSTLLGQDSNGNPRYFNGSMDEVRFYNTSLSAAAIAALANPVPTVATAAAATPSPVTGTTTALSVLGASSVYGESNLTYTWTATSIPSGATAPTYSVNGTNAAKNTTVTFSNPGAYTFKVTIADPNAASVTSSVNVTVNLTFTNVAVSPATVTLGSSGGQQFSATANDQFGNALSTQPGITWSLAGVGSLNSSGLYSAPYASGTAMVTATMGSLSGQSSVTVSNAAPTVATAATASPGTVTGTTTSLSVLGADSDGGGEPNLTYTWSTTSLPSGATAPIFSANGSNAAKNTIATFSSAGAYTLKVTMTDAGGLWTSSSVNVTVSQTMSGGITLSPTTASVGSHGTQQFTVSGVDQFGASMSPTVTWSTTGAGSVSSSGLYTGSYAPGTATVTTTTGSLTAAASVTVTNATPTVATAASAAPMTVTGTSTNLSVLGADSDGGGEGNLTYTWAATTMPTGAVAPTYSANGTNAAKNTTATLSTLGDYTFTVTIADLGGLSVTSSVNVVVTNTANGVWTNASGGSWTNSANWSSGTVAAGVGATADFSTLNLTADATVTLDGARTIGNLAFGDTTPSNNWILNTGSAGPLTLNVSSGTPTITVNNQTTTIGPALAGTKGLAKAGAGTLILTGNNTYTGTTTINGGTLDFKTPSYNSYSGGQIYINNGSTMKLEDGGGSHRYDFATVTYNFDANGGGTISTVGSAMNWVGMGSWTFKTNGGAKNTINGAAGMNLNGSGHSVVLDVTRGTDSATDLDISIVVGNTNGSLTKTSNGIVSLDAANTYTGGTSINAGTLLVKNTTGSGTGTGAVAVNSSGTLGGTGTISGAVTVASGGTLAPGFGGVATLTLKSTLTLGGAAAMDVNKSTGTSDLVQGLTSVTYGGTLTVTNLGGTFAVGDTFRLFSAVSYSGSFATLNLPALPADLAWNTSSLSVNGCISVVAIPPTVASAASASPAPVTGLSTNLSVLGGDAAGESGLTYTWATVSLPSGAAAPTFSSNGSNAAKNTVVSVSQAGAYGFQVTIANAVGGSVTSSVNVTVNQTLTSIVVSPAVANVGSLGSQSFAAVGYDQFGQTVVPQPSMTWSNTGSGLVGGSGVYMASATSGSATVTATSGTVSGSGSVTVSNAAPTVATAAAASPGTVIGTTTSLSVLGADSDGGGEPNLTYSWSAASLPSGAAAPTYSANWTNAAKNTTATFSGAGAYTLKVTITDSGGLSTSSSVNVTVNQTLTGITLSPATATVGSHGTQQFTASGVDQFGASMLPAVTWSTTGAGSVSSSGLYTGSYASGTGTVMATSGSVSGSASVTVTNAAPTVATAAAASPGAVTGTTTSLAVLGADSDGGGESNLTYTWSATNVPSGAAAPTYSANGTNAAKHTTATFSGAGAYTLMVTITDAGGLSTSSSVNVTVNQTSAGITLSPATATVGSHGTQQFTASGVDQFGASMSPAVTWSTTGAGSVSSSGLYTGSYASSTGTVTATIGSVSGSASVTVTNAAPTVATAAAASPGTVTGTITSLSVLGADSDGGGESNLTYTWTATSVPSGAAVPTYSANGTNGAKNTTATFSGAGAYTLMVTITDAGGLSASSSVNVKVCQRLATITLTPATVSVGSNDTQQFVASSVDQFGASMSPAVTWSTTGSGSVSSSGLYTASYASGAGTVTATSGSVSGSASVTVTNAAPTVATAASASPSPVTGSTSSLSVLGGDSDGGGESNLTYTWSATIVPSGAAAPTYSINGTNAAKNTTATFSSAGAYTLMVTITDAGGLSTTSSVNVTVNQTLTSIVVSPKPASVSSLGTQTFAATGYDQFGQVLSLQSSITWSNTGSGSIAGSGVYTASAGSGSATVTATSGSVSGSSVVTITNAAPTIATAAVASPGTVTGTTTSLSVLGADSDGGGESNLTYTWTATALPTGAPTPTFSENGTNDSKNTTATFGAAGTYTLTATITDAGGLSVASSVNVTVSQILSSVKITPATATVTSNQSVQLAGVGLDQFGTALLSQPSFTWAVTSGTGTVNRTGLYPAPASAPADRHQGAAASAGSSGSGSVNSAGLYTAPTTATVDTVTGTSGSLQAIAQISVIPGLVDEWKFDDGAGTIAADSGPGAHAGTVNGATWTTGLFGGALSFNGTNSTVTFGTGPALYDTTDFTVSAWVKTTATTTGVIIQQRDNGGLNGEYQLSVNSNGTVGFMIYGKGSYQFPNSALTTTATVNDGKWHQVAALRQGAVGQIYIDGTVAASATGTVRGLVRSTKVSVGGDVRDNVNYFNGLIDDVRIYNVALSAAQIGTALGNQAPTVAIAAAASPNPVLGSSVNLSVLGADDGGEAGLTYTWAATSVPSGVSAPTFTANGTNASKNTTAVFSGPGAYTFTVTLTDAAGLTATSSVSLTVGGNLPSGWASADVGAVGVPGWSSANGGVYTVNGSGTDIGGTVDAFQFSAQTLTGDGEIRARVTSQSNTNAAAKAGVMLRDGSGSGAVNALVALTPGSGFVFQSRNSSGGTTTQGGTAASNTAPNNWVRLTRSGTLVSAYVSADGVSWTSVGTVTLTMSSSISAGLVVTSDNNSVSGTATFDNVSVTPLPAPWQSLDLGTTGLQGSAEYFNGAYTMKGAGTIGGTSDNFHFLYQSLSGDGSIVARISTLQNTGTGASVGVMIRDGLTSGSMYAYAGVDGTGAFQWLSRSGTGGNTTQVSGGSGTAPNLWVEVVRSGNTLTGYQSSDGVSWTQIYTQTITMGTDIYLGFINASGSTSTLNTSVFDNVSVVP